MKELGHGDMRTGSEIAEDALTFGGAEEEEDFLFGGGSGVFGEETEEGFGWGVGLDVGAPGYEVPAGGDEFAGLVVAPDCGPPSAFCFEEDGTVAKVAGYKKLVEEFINYGGFVRCHDSNCSTDFEIYTEFFGIICHVEVEMIRSLLCARTREFSSTPDLRRVDIIWRMRLDKIRRLNLRINFMNLLLCMRCEINRVIRRRSNRDRRIGRRRNRLALLNRT